MSGSSASPMRSDWADAEAVASANSTPARPIRMDCITLSPFQLLSTVDGSTLALEGCDKPLQLRRYPAVERQMAGGLSNIAPHVASRGMPVIANECGPFAPALVDNVRTPGMEVTTPRRIDRTWRVTRQKPAFPLSGGGRDRDGRQQCLRIGV